MRERGREGEREVERGSERQRDASGIRERDEMNDSSCSSSLRRRLSVRGGDRFQSLTRTTNSADELSRRTSERAAWAEHKGVIKIRRPQRTVFLASFLDHIGACRVNGVRSQLTRRQVHVVVVVVTDNDDEDMINDTVLQTMTRLICINSNIFSSCIRVHDLKLP